MSHSSSSSSSSAKYANTHVAHTQRSHIHIHMPRQHVHIVSSRQQLAEAATEAGQSGQRGPQNVAANQQFTWTWAVEWAWLKWLGKPSETHSTQAEGAGRRNAERQLVRVSEIATHARQQLLMAIVWHVQGEGCSTWVTAYPLPIAVVVVVVASGFHAVSGCCCSVLFICLSCTSFAQNQKPLFTVIVHVVVVAAPLRTFC